MPAVLLFSQLALFLRKWLLPFLAERLDFNQKTNNKKTFLKTQAKKAAKGQRRVQGRVLMGAGAEPPPKSLRNRHTMNLLRS